MNKYVLGFAFDDLDRVALIQKERPAWQAGKLNGVGGRIEGREEVLDAMVREFHEETGVVLPNWDVVGVMRGADWHVTVLTATSPEVRDVSTVTDEVVMLYVPGSLSPRECLANVITLIGLCSMPPEPPSNKRPTFVLYY